MMVESKLLGSKPNVGQALVPSSPMLRAALSGLFALGACGDDAGSKSDESTVEHAHDAELSDEKIEALCKEQVKDGVDKALADQDVDKLCAEQVADAKKAAEPADAELPKLCSSMVSDARGELDADVKALKDQVKKLEDEVKAGKDEVKALREKAGSLLLTSEEKTISAEQKEYTFAELTSMCDKRGGYTQIHAACGGHNACAGFSYGDWGPGAAMLTEHSCTGVNGCLGLSCVELPKDAGRTGKELYEGEDVFPEPLNDCGGCHGGYYDDKEKWIHDKAYFAVYVPEGSKRTAENWLDRSAREQELVTAFGARGLLPNGAAYQDMGEYHGVLSRAETERVVAYIRTLKPYVRTIKMADPPADTTQ